MNPPDEAPDPEGNGASAAKSDQGRWPDVAGIHGVNCEKSQLRINVSASAPVAIFRAPL
jgi:hypothetical protein